MVAACSCIVDKGRSWLSLPLGLRGKCCSDALSKASHRVGLTPACVSSAKQQVQAAEVVSSNIVVSLYHALCLRSFKTIQTLANEDAPQHATYYWWLAGVVVVVQNGAAAIRCKRRSGATQCMHRPGFLDADVAWVLECMCCLGVRTTGAPLTIYQRVWWELVGNRDDMKPCTAAANVIIFFPSHLQLHMLLCRQWLLGTHKVSSCNVSQRACSCACVRAAAQPRGRGVLSSPCLL
ncbi:hypothetical protein COO60DRAFT_1296998 [Scenedesmus sp. NREL 46B-D3]|nr:hypothetical protein COO60DRAFT_1296998 [Scenedesmus sp. NREL 46B-D3]